MSKFWPKRSIILLPSINLRYCQVNLLAMSEMNLAERFNAVNQAQDRKEHNNKLQNMNMEQLGAMTIKFGDTKVGQTYQTVVTEDPKYCQWFLRKYATSEKTEHVEFIYFLSQWVDRKELELGDSAKTPIAKAMPKAKTGTASGKAVRTSMECIDLEEEEESWDPVLGSTTSIKEEQNAQRLDQIENVLAQVMQQLQVLTAKQV
jgi:hypothetical protein